MGPEYPLRIIDQREYPEGFDGDVFVWDVDKTYLDTRFSSLGGLARIPVEFAVDKRAIVGMPEVLRGLRRGPGPAFACAPLYFVSASPPLVRGSVERRMMMDGVEYDGLTFKDWGACLTGLRPGRLREQVGFKVCALLEGRLRRPASREFLFGDDAESDAEAYHLYAGLLEHGSDTGFANRVMTDAGMAPDDRECAGVLLGRLEGLGAGRVERAFIHLHHDTDPGRFEPLGPLVIPVRGAVQLALALYGLDIVGPDTVGQAIEAVVSSASVTQIDDLVHDASARGLIRDSKLKEVSRWLHP